MGSTLPSRAALTERPTSNAGDRLLAFTYTSDTRLIGMDDEAEARIVEKVEYIEEAVTVLSHKQSLERPRAFTEDSETGEYIGELVGGPVQETGRVSPMFQQH